MGLTKKQISHTSQVIKNSLRHRFENYKPEPASMPFHTRLLGGDRLALYSFIHSLTTSFGTIIFEPVAQTIAKNNFKVAKLHITAGEYISEAALNEIQKIMDNITTAVSSPNKADEIDSIRKVCQVGTMRKVKLRVVDLCVETHANELYFFDLKTAKPNAGGFEEFKRTLLLWVAAVLAAYPKTKINTAIAIPYNPYEPQPYTRWTMRGILDLKNELKVANEFWDFLGGSGTYQDLLDCFERVGIELRDEIDEYFDRFNK